MQDIAPELIDEIEKTFETYLIGSPKVKRLYERIRDGTATYSEANEFSIEIGNLLAKTFKLKLSSDTLPDGRMYYNIADRVLNRTLKRNYDLISDYTSTVQELINDANKIGMKAIVPEIDEARLEEIIGKVSNALNYDEIAWLLDDPIINFCQSIIDDFVRENAKAQSNAGIDVTVTRIVSNKCCSWCASLAGTYDYDSVSNSGNDIWKRHDRCRCSVKPSFEKTMRKVGHAFVSAQ